MKNEQNFEGLITRYLYSKFTIEDVDYFFYESYFVNGSGYTFGIFQNEINFNELEYPQRVDNIYYGYGSGYGSNLFVCIGEKFNYTFERKPHKEVDDFVFENLTQYHKDVLTCDKFKNRLEIKLKNETLFCFRF